MFKVTFAVLQQKNDSVLLLINLNASLYSYITYAQQYLDEY